MAIKIDKKAVSLLYRYFIKGSSEVRQIPYFPQKTRIIDTSEQKHLPRATPESRGIDSTSLLRMLSQLESDKDVDIHSIAVLSDDAVICEASVPGQNASLCALTHSLCKTVTALAVGMLVDEGRLSLNQRIYKIFSDEVSEFSPRQKKLTVYHLLTMSSGALFNELGVVSSTDWVRDFFGFGVDFEAGSKFAYNSMNSYMLSAIVKKVGGVSMSELLRTRLFDVLGVPDFIWETCPKAIEKGGWGLYVSVETMLKLGTLFINGGVYDGTRVVSEKWINEMKRMHMPIAEETGGYDYGLHMWVGRYNSACLFNGMFGQNILVFPKRRIVVATTASNCEMFQKSRMLDIISDTFTDSHTYIEKTKKQTKVYKKLKIKQKNFGAHHTWTRPQTRLHGVRALIARLQGRSPYPLPHFCRSLDKKIYTFEKNNSSLMPIIMSFMQNSFGEGLESVSFAERRDGFHLLLREGGEGYDIKLGFYSHAKNILRIRGEIYVVAAAAEFSFDEDKNLLLKIELCFPETSSVRRMKLAFDGDRLCMRLSELPGYEMVGAYVAGMKVVAPKSDPLVNILAPSLKGEFVSYKIRSSLEPVICAKEIGGKKLTNPCKECDNY
jgi:hypothetical protein